MIKAIVFDLWETLGTKNIGISKTLMGYFNIEKTYDSMIKYESSIQLIAWKNEDEMASNFLKSFHILNTKQNHEFVVNTLRSGIEKATLYEGMEELLKRLKRTYKLGILSNTTIFESQVPKKWGINKLFDSCVYSWQISSLKPSKNNFDEICKELHVNSSECIFIDDDPKNIDSAKNLGLKSIVYENIDTLKNELKLILKI